MKYEKVVAHFGGLTKAAQALDLPKQNVHAWGTRGRIPARWQMKIEAMTDGALRADRHARLQAIEMASYVIAGGR